MGMFDSFLVPITCPYSGKKIEVEFQTKEFQCCCEVWKIGDVFTGEGIKIFDGEIEVWGYCECVDCRRWKENRTGRSIAGMIVIRNGRVGGVRNIEADENDR